jgi:hypothetical protein
MRILIIIYRIYYLKIMQQIDFLEFINVALYLR